MYLKDINGLREMLAQLVAGAGRVVAAQSFGCVSLAASSSLCRYRGTDWQSRCVRMFVDSSISSAKSSGYSHFMLDIWMLLKHPFPSHHDRSEY